MKAEKSLSSRLSRRNISVAGSADHSVIAFIFTLSACSSSRSAGSNRDQSTSVARFQRACSRDLKSSGYSGIASPFLVDRNQRNLIEIKSIVPARHGEVTGDPAPRGAASGLVGGPSCATGGWSDCASAACVL